MRKSGGQAGWSILWAGPWTGTLTEAPFFITWMKESHLWPWALWWVRQMFAHVVQVEIKTQNNPQVSQEKVQMFMSIKWKRCISFRYSRDTSGGDHIFKCSDLFCTPLINWDICKSTPSVRCNEVKSFSHCALNELISVVFITQVYSVIWFAAPSWTSPGIITTTMWMTFFCVCFCKIASICFEHLISLLNYDAAPSDNWPTKLTLALNFTSYSDQTLCGRHWTRLIHCGFTARGNYSLDCAMCLTIEAHFIYLSIFQPKGLTVLSDVHSVLLSVKLFANSKQ